MITPLRLAALLASFSLSQALLAGCGGQGSSSSATGSSATRGSTTESTQNAASVTFGKPHPRETAATRAERRRAGNAASFVKPGQDNSVPTFGSEASPSERGEAEATLRAYLGARASREWARACSLLAASVRHGFEKLASSTKQDGKATCAQVMPALAPVKPGVPANPLQGALLAFRVHGPSAFALFTGPPSQQQYIVPMSREGGAWRPTQAAPIAYPPGAP